MPTPPRRRWFQISLAEWLILTTLLGVAWWQCASWPVVDRVPDTGPDAPKAIFAWGYVFPPRIVLVDVERMPPPGVVAVRGAIASIAIIGVWLVGSIAVRAIVRRCDSATRS